MSASSPDPTSEAPPEPPDPRPPLETDHTSLVEALDILSHPTVQAVLRDNALMRPVLAKDSMVLGDGTLQTASIQALLGDAALVQRISALAVEEENMA